MRPYLLILAGIVFFLSCKSKPKSIDGFMVLKGKTMGTKYEIAYKSQKDYQASIDSLLENYIKLLSLYDSNSIISKFNDNAYLSKREEANFQLNCNYFDQLDSISKRLNQESIGIFNPGLGGLLAYWGTGGINTFPQKIQKTSIDSLKRLDFGCKIAFNNGKAIKSNALQQINFNAIAIGHVVDIIAQKFDSVYHLNNYYINIGGKIRVKGNNGHDSYWPIIIEKPMINSLKQIEFCSLPLKNYSLSTCSKLKHFNFSNGQRYSQYINPKSGFPAKNELLSTNILAPSAIEASGYANICMVLGLVQSIEFVKRHPSLKAFFIYEKDEKIQFWSSDNLAFKLAKKSD